MPHSATRSQSTYMNSAANSRIGPRAKCSQVVYEAIAKACEIVVRSRSSSLGVQVNSKSDNGITQVKSSSCSVGSGGTSGRFNIEIDEVPQVRSVLQRWRRSLHVPIRLDVELLRHSCNNKTTRQLLERWCIDFLESPIPDSLDSNTRTNIDGTIDTLPQLRQVCKRVVILLRTLYCVCRMLPAYKLHLRLVSCSSNKGYYASNSMAIEGNICFTIYAIGSHDEKIQKGSTESFVKHDFVPVPTPYGVLKLCALYDKSISNFGSDKISIPTSLPKISISGMSSNYRNCEEEIQRKHQQGKNHDAAVSDFIIQDYAENRFHTPQATTENVLNKDKEEEGIKSTTRVLSGLSLALMNDQGDKNQKESFDKKETFDCKESPEFINKAKLPRMHSLDERSYWGDNKNFGGRAASHDKSTFSSSASPRSYNIHSANYHHPFIGGDNEMTKSISNEYGYGYNNITLGTPSTNSRPIRITSNNNRGRSPNPRETFSTTPPNFPFSRSPSSFANIVMSPCLSSSPPFSVNPVTLKSSSLQRHRTCGSQSNTINTLNGSQDGIPPPPLSFDSIQASPFEKPNTKNPNSSHISALSLPPSFSGGLNYDETTAFVGSLGSTASVSFERNIESDEQGQGHMPFASLSENRSSIHEGDASTASTFAYRCATASRLQLFNKKNACHGTPTNKFDENASHSSSPVHDNDMSNQLAEFHNFSASLNVSVHRTNNNSNGNVINSGTQPALAC